MPTTLDEARFRAGDALPPFEGSLGTWATAWQPPRAAKGCESPSRRRRALLQPHARPAPAATLSLRGCARPAPRRRAAQLVLGLHAAWVKAKANARRGVRAELAALVAEAARRLRPRRYARMGSGGGGAKERTARVVFAALLRCAQEKPGVLSALMRGTHPKGLLPLWTGRTGDGV